MGFRVTLTSLLTVILLSLSSGASACEIQCDMSRSGSSCGETQAVNEQMTAMASTMAGHACCGRSTNISTHSCNHLVFANQPAVLSKRVSIAVYSNCSLAVAVPEPPVVATFPLTASVWLRGPPRFLPKSPVSLHTTLRV